MKTMRLPLNLLSVAFGLFIATAGVSRVDAKTSRKVSHAYEKVWPVAVRFLRIDEGLKVLEKDMENGYLLFEIAEEGKRFSGSVEVIRRTDDSKRSAVELILTIKDRPSYMESGILDRMLTKIRVELGLPQDAPAEPEKPDESKEEAPPEADKDTIE